MIKYLKLLKNTEIRINFQNGKSVFIGTETILKRNIFVSILGQI